MKILVEQELNKILQDFKKCKSKKKYYMLIDNYYILKTIIELSNLDIIINEDFLYELNKYNIDKIYQDINYLFNTNYLIMNDYNIKFTSSYKDIINNIKSEGYNKRINFSDSVELASEFFKYYDKDIHDYFDELIKSRFLITNKIIGGITSKSTNTLKSYSFVNVSNTINDFFVIIHETMHNYLFDKLKYISHEKSINMRINNLYEVYPLFIENVAINYMNNNNIMNKEINNYKSLMCDKIIYLMNDYYQNLINHDINQYYIENEAYTYGYVLGYYFYEQYLKNKELGKKNILDFTLQDQYHDKKYMLNNFGLNEKELLNSKKLKKFFNTSS